MGKKKILFVYPSSYDSQGGIIKSRKSFLPFRSLPYLAALTPEKHFETYIIDELIDDLDFDEDIDLVALSGMLRHMPRAIDIAREFRKHGKPSVIGGVGAFAIREKIERSGVFKSFVIGEADELWKTVLDDFDRGQLKRRYECTSPPQLKGLPPARFDLLNLRKYMRSFYDLAHPLTLVETSRGCPHNCRFCLVTRYFGKKLRYRPVGEVVEEVRRHGSRYVMFTDDNIAINPIRAQELFLAVKPLKIQWVGQFESGVVKHPKLLQLAAESGCQSAVVGIESLLSENLQSVDKSMNIKWDFRDVAGCFRAAGIPLIASMIFGMDYDTPQTIEWTVEEMIKNKVDILLPWILTPVPGTPLYDDCKKEGRLIHENYSLYDCCHAVMRPARMTAEELEGSMWKGLERFYSIPNILLRVYWEKRWKMRVPGCLYNLYFRKQIQRGLHIFAGNAS